jgi:hypothetical protein
MFYPQSSFYPQGSFGAQGSFNPQGNFNPLASPGPQGFQAYPGIIPYANTLLAHQLAAQQFATQHPSGLTGFSGLSNGVAQPSAVWPQQQLNPEQLNPGLVQPQRHYQLLQQLAQFHYLVAQQLAQLAAQQVVQSAGSPYTGQFNPGQQFIPGQLGTNYVPGGTMH